MTEWLIDVAYSNITLTLCFFFGVLIGMFGLIKAAVSTKTQKRDKASLYFMSGVLIASPASLSVLFKTFGFVKQEDLFPWICFVIGWLLFYFVNSKYYNKVNKPSELIGE